MTFAQKNQNKIFHYCCQLFWLDYVFSKKCPSNNRHRPKEFNSKEKFFYRNNFPVFFPNAFFLFFWAIIVWATVRNHFFQDRFFSMKHFIYLNFLFPDFFNRMLFSGVLFGNYILIYILRQIANNRQKPFFKETFSYRFFVSWFFYQIIFPGLCLFG